MVDLTIGKFRHPVTIRTTDKTKDESAGYDETHPILVQTWAALDHKGGSRTFDNGAMVVFDRMDIYLRWRSAFSVLNQDSIFEVDGVRYKYQNKSFVNNEKKILKVETVGT